MAQGTGEHSASLDYAEVGGASGRNVNKKGGPGGSAAAAAAASSSAIKETRSNCDKIFKLLTCHPSGYLFIQPLDPSHPKFSVVSKDYINLNMIELNFRQNKYQNTFNLEQDFRKMLHISFQMYQDQPEIFGKIQ